ncbi:uncharacterized protein A4U43_C03F21660 [Asparagus officinalis]|uniref:Uncharacterized protein n=1 Tax=Asparagus officinalis TaxID=4686 RepID=A0A5P1FGX1_ASPOF|nr:uncharacterized protein A4U43_C03F21660 [Asparagus officinalis]
MPSLFFTIQTVVHLIKLIFSLQINIFPSLGIEWQGTQLVKIYKQWVSYSLIMHQLRQVEEEMKLVRGPENFGASNLFPMALEVSSFLCRETKLEYYRELLFASKFHVTR